MEVNETRNCLVTDIRLKINGETRLFNSGGLVKSAYFQKKWSIPLLMLELYQLG